MSIEDNSDDERYFNRGMTTKPKSRYVSFQLSMSLFEARAILAGLTLDANPDTKDWRDRLERLIREHDEKGGGR